MIKLSKELIAALESLKDTDLEAMLKYYCIYDRQK